MESLVITAGLKLSLPGKLHPVKTSIAPAKSLISKQTSKLREVKLLPGKLTPILALDKSLIGKQSAQLRSANSHLKCGIEKVNQIKLSRFWECTVKPFLKDTITNRTPWGKANKIRQRKIAYSDLTGKPQLVHFMCGSAFTQFSVKNSSSLQFPQTVEIKQNQNHPFLDCGGVHG